MSNPFILDLIFLWYSPIY